MWFIQKYFSVVTLSLHKSLKHWNIVEGISTDTIAVSCTNYGTIVLENFNELIYIINI